MPLCVIRVPFEDLPDSVQVSGQAVVDGGYDEKYEKNSDKVVLKFRRESVSDVRRQLQDKTYDRVEIEDIIFPKA